MPATHKPLLVMLFVALLTTSACTFSREDAATLQAQAAVFQAEVLGSLEDIDRELDELEVYVANAVPERRLILQNALVELHTQRAKLHKDLHLLDGAGGQALNTQHRTITRRLHDLLLEVEAAHLNASPSPQAFLDASILRLAELAQNLEELHRKARQEATGQPLREAVDALYRQHEAVARQVERLRATQGDAFSAGRAAVTASLSEVAARVGEARRGILPPYEDETPRNHRAAL